MSWAANFVATLQNTFNSHGTHKIRCSFNTIIIINVKWKKGTRTLATNEEWKKRANTETRSLSLSLARWIKRAKPIEEWVLSFRKHARKTYTAKQRWRFYQRLFCSYFSFSHWRLWWLLLLLLLFGFLKDGARPSFFHSFVVFFSILRFPCTFWLAFFPAFVAKCLFLCRTIRAPPTKSATDYKTPANNDASSGEWKKNNCTQNNNPHCFSALKLNEYECRKLVSFHFASLVFPILILCMWLCGWRFFFVC